MTTPHKALPEIPPMHRIVTNGESYRIQRKDATDKDWRFVEDCEYYDMGGCWYPVEFTSFRLARKRMLREIADSLQCWRSKTEHWVPVDGGTQLKVPSDPNGLKSDTASFIPNSSSASPTESAGDSSDKGAAR